MADPGIQLNCPWCGVRLVYVRTDGDTYVYHCLRHGMLLLSPAGWRREHPPS